MGSGAGVLIGGEVWTGGASCGADLEQPVRSTATVIKRTSSRIVFFMGNLLVFCAGSLMDFEVIINEIGENINPFIRKPDKKQL
jgi:hypothetical protein